MIKDVVAFEWRYHTRQASFIAAALIFFLFGFALTARAFGPANVNIDSPYSIAQTVALLSLFSVFVQPLTTRVPGLLVGAWTMVGGGIISLLVAVPSMLDVSWQTLSPAVYGALAYSTIGAMVIAYLFWYQGVKILGPTHTSMYSNMQPFLAMAFAWLALGEVPSRWQITGAAFILSGLVVARTATQEPEAG